MSKNMKERPKKKYKDIDEFADQLIQKEMQKMIGK